MYTHTHTIKHFTIDLCRVQMDTPPRVAHLFQRATEKDDEAAEISARARSFADHGNHAAAAPLFARAAFCHVVAANAIMQAMAQTEFSDGNMADMMEDLSFACTLTRASINMYTQAAPVNPSRDTAPLLHRQSIFMVVLVCLTREAHWQNIARVRMARLVQDFPARAEETPPRRVPNRVVIASIDEAVRRTAEMWNLHPNFVAEFAAAASAAWGDDYVPNMV